MPIVDHLKITAILYFDYTLTIIDEIEYIWRQPWKLTTVFYVFCRYSLVANVLFFVLTQPDKTPEEVGPNIFLLLCWRISDQHAKLVTSAPVFGRCHCLNSDFGFGAGVMLGI
jgi:hypothetical protein